MERHIDAANLEKISWANGTLRIYYKNGQVAAYKNVPEGIAVGMAQAPSAGSYMTLYIAGKYGYVIEPEVNYPKKFETIKEAAKPLIKYLCENYNPHVTAIVTGTSIELVEGLISIPKIYDYLID